jgi:hypothetical protein
MDSGAMQQMIADRFGLNAEEMQAVQAGDVQPLLARRLASGTIDPLTAMLVSSALKQRPVGTTLVDEAAQLQEALDRAQQTIVELKGHLANADGMISQLAETFGACPVCWGTTERCPRCRGTGTPGRFSLPHEEPLIAWVTPALGRIGLRVVKEGN